MQKIFLEEVGLSALLYRFRTLCRSGRHTELLKFLMAEVAPLSSEEQHTLFFDRDEQDQRTVLHTLIYNEAVEKDERVTMLFALLQCCETLLPERLKAFIDTRDAEGRTALMLASAKAWSSTLVEVLISGRLGDICVREHADLHLRDLYGFTALHLAAYNGREESVDLLIGYGLRLDAFSHRGETPVSLAAAKGQARTLKVLLTAVQKDQRLYLLNQCVDVDGNTPLHHASMRNYTKAASYLMEQGADPALVNYANLSPDDYALLYGQIYAGTEHYKSLNDEDLLIFRYEDHTHKVKTVKEYMRRDLFFRVFYARIKQLVAESLFLNDPAILEEAAYFETLYAQYKSVYHVIYYPAQREEELVLLNEYLGGNISRLMDAFVEEMQTLQPRIIQLAEQRQVLEAELQAKLIDAEELSADDEEAQSQLIEEFNEQWEALQKVKDHCDYLKNKLDFLCEVVKRISDALRFVDKKANFPFTEETLPLKSLLQWAKPIYLEFSRATHDFILTLDEDPLGLKQAWSANLGKHEKRLMLHFPELLPEITPSVTETSESLAKIAYFLEAYPLPVKGYPVCFTNEPCDMQVLTGKLRMWLGEAVHVMPVSGEVDDPNDLAWQYRFQQQIADLRNTETHALDRPVIYFFREHVSGFAHYSVCVLMPSHYTLNGTGLDSVFEFDRSRLIYINPMDLSLLPHPQLITLLPDLEWTYGMIQGRMQNEPSDNGWWCLYSALQVILTGGSEFLGNFQHHFGQRATVLRGYFDGLGLQVSPIEPVDEKTEGKTRGFQI